MASSPKATPFTCAAGARFDPGKIFEPAPTRTAAHSRVTCPTGYASRWIRRRVDPLNPCAAEAWAGVKHVVAQCPPTLHISEFWRSWELREDEVRAPARWASEESEVAGPMSTRILGRRTAAAAAFPIPRPPPTWFLGSQACCVPPWPPPSSRAQGCRRAPPCHNGHAPRHQGRHRIRLGRAPCVWRHTSTAITPAHRECVARASQA